MMVVAVLLPVIYLSLKNNELNLLSNLTTLCFGYFFGKQNSPL